MHAAYILPALLSVALAQSSNGEGEGFPDPPPQTLATTMSGVLPVIPAETPFVGEEINEGALVYDGPANPT